MGSLHSPSEVTTQSKRITAESKSGYWHSPGEVKDTVQMGSGAHSRGCQCTGQGATVDSLGVSMAGAQFRWGHCTVQAELMIQSNWCQNRIQDCLLRSPGSQFRDNRGVTVQSREVSMQSRWVCAQSRLNHRVIQGVSAQPRWGQSVHHQGGVSAQSRGDTSVFRGTRGKVHGVWVVRAHS